MRVLIAFSILIFGLTTACKGLNDLRNIKRYHGVWSLSSLEVSTFDETGKILTTAYSDTVTGRLELYKDMKYVSEGIHFTPFLNPGGKLVFGYKTKKDVLIFDKNRATVLKKKPKEMELVFYLGDGTGKASSKSVFAFEYKEKVVYE